VTYSSLGFKTPCQISALLLYCEGDIIERSTILFGGYFILRQKYYY